MRTFFRFAALAICAIAFVGCFEFGEDVWVNADGSGRLRFEVALPQAFMEFGKSIGSADTSNDDIRTKFRNADSLFKKDPRVTRVTVRDTTYSAMYHMLFEIDAKSYNDLPALSKMFYSDTAMSSSENQEQAKPELQFTTTGSSVHFAILIPKDSTEEADSTRDTTGDAIAAAMLGDGGLVFRLHAPKISSSNGTIDTATNTAEWKIPLSNMKHVGGRQFTAEISMPVPIAPITSPAVWLWVALAAVVLVVFVVFVLRKSSKSSAS